MANTIQKNKTAKIPTKSGKDYSYTYTDLASINKWLDENGLDYYQEIETCETNGKDYINTYRYINGEWEDKPKRGCQVVDATLLGVSNPAQQNGSALTYARRYSLCLAFGLATEDNDANDLTTLKEITKEDAESYTFQSGKHEGWTLKRVVEEDQGFLKWLLNNSKDERLLKMIEVLTGEVPKTDKEWDDRLALTQKLQQLIVDKGLPIDDILKNKGLTNIRDLPDDDLKEIVNYYEKLYNVQDIIKYKNLDEEAILSHYKADKLDGISIDYLDEIIAKRG